MEDKEQVTQYILQKFSEWYKEMKPNASSNDLSILKSLKLIFLLSTVNANNKDRNLLDLYFKDFLAMPLGPVEIKTYHYFKDSDFINIDGLQANSLLAPNVFNNKQIIDECLDILKNLNPKLILYTASQLVDLTHKYACWIKYYQIGIEAKSRNQPIPIHDIKNDEKFYFI